MITPILRFIGELILYLKLGQIHFVPMIIYTNVSLIYSTEICMIYVADDDNMPENDCGMKIINAKPWQFEDLSLPK